MHRKLLAIFVMCAIFCCASAQQTRLFAVMSNIYNPQDPIPVTMGIYSIDLTERTTRLVLPLPTSPQRVGYYGQESVVDPKTNTIYVIAFSQTRQDDAILFAIDGNTMSVTRTIPLPRLFVFDMWWSVSLSQIVIMQVTEDAQARIVYTPALLEPQSGAVLPLSLSIRGCGTVGFSGTYSEIDGEYFWTLNCGGTQYFYGYDVVKDRLINNITTDFFLSSVGNNVLAQNGAVYYSTYNVSLSHPASGTQLIGGILPPAPPAICLPNSAHGSSLLLAADYTNGNIWAVDGFTVLQIVNGECYTLGSFTVDPSTQLNVNSIFVLPNQEN